MTRRRPSPFALTLMGLLALLGGATVARAQAPEGAAGLGAALQPSTAQQKALAEHLQRSGVVFYGAWWCPACFRQKALFGDQAGNRLPYVECDRDKAGRDRCQAAGIRAFPTWVKGNERLEGVQSLEALQSWSNFGR
ncbi:MAG: hypothetical protein VKO00_04640 [Cyanobacteriota bacterium]|nr:hypothetical protein [Cyanobacteriota bacterium]